MSAIVTTPTAPAGPDLAHDLATTALAVARRIATGATLWCVAPSAPAHAAHLAVEFLHPVIVGKRAVPAVAVEGTDACDVVRAGVRPGDVLLLLGRADDTELLALARRAAPWAALTVWFVTDGGTPSVRPDHVLETGEAVGLVLGYHLLWELTHVVFEHPGLLHEDDDDPTVCVTCADDARVAEVLAAAGPDARVRIDGRDARVVVELVDDVAIGDLVLVHAGVAILRIEEPS